MAASPSHTAGWLDIEIPCASLPTRSPNQSRIPGKPGFSTFECGCGRETDSPLEGDGFELVWGFSCQAVVLGCADSFLFGAGKAVFRSLIAPRVAREFFSLEAVSSPWPVDRRAKRILLWRWGRLVPVANRRAPRASRSALTSDGAARAGGACLPTGAKPGWHSAAVF
jgi:hypothetical protein